MRLSLSDQDLGQLEEVQRILLSPLAYAHVDAWRSAANASLKALVGADLATFILPMPAPSRVYSDEVPTWVRAAYADQYFSVLLPRWNVQATELRLGAWSRDQLYGPKLRDLYKSTYYNELVVPARAFDAIGVTVRAGPSAAVASLYCHHERQGGRRFGDRGVALLRLLLPAFTAGVESHLRLTRIRRALCTMVDHLPSAAVLFDVVGNVLHENAAFTTLVAGHPEAAAVRACCAQAAATVGVLAERRRGAASRTSAPAAPLSTEWRIGTTRYRISASMVAEELHGPDPLVAVVIDRVTAAPPSPTDMKARYRLTQRELEVAMLVGAGWPNRRIASHLGISEHTARRHTERLLTKLGVHSRAAVSGRLTGLLGEDPTG